MLFSFKTFPLVSFKLTSKSVALPYVCMMSLAVKIEVTFSITMSAAVDDAL